jgi:hypothetical protein
MRKIIINSFTEKHKVNLLLPLGMANICKIKSLHELESFTMGRVMFAPSQRITMTIGLYADSCAGLKSISHWYN